MGGAIFNGYFSVDNDTNLVTAFYETINGSTDFNNSILGPANNPCYSDNVFNPNLSFSIDGVNITSISLQHTFNTATPYYNLYEKYSLYKPRVIDEKVNVVVTPISDPSCFNEGTKILCLNKNLDEEYIPIENLRKGDLVKSYKHGYRKIDLIGKNPMINNPEKFNECMYKMEKTEDNGLLEDLIVTGGHSILVDDLGDLKEENDKIFGSTQMIDDKYLLLSVLSNDFVKLENIELYTYYHFILENDGNNYKRYGVWANGILTETPSKNQFTDHKYTLL